ncbi:hypothetical protein HYDPIDRAFT_40736 [Hydnomerulius pinastri MD-312]|uniref:WD40 repeat-like protein n=1 Tax=Hydnomerulius pinastri MD-312 TaxID=994086 RepID=A0A0C9W038_9AGAM|nr:hypothetical protein HYDPIDRAFT_40736 [Hydnomerulius pinastri MD-312]
MHGASMESINYAQKPVLTMSGHSEPISGIVFLSEGDRVWTCSWDQTMRLWDTATGEEEGMRMEHGDMIMCVAVTKDGKRIVSGNDHKLKVWEGHETGILSVAFSPDGEFVASGDDQGRIVIRETKSGGAIRHSIETTVTIRSLVNSLSFSPSGEKIATGHSDRIIRVFDVTTADLVLTPVTGNKYHTNSVLWSLDGSHLFAGSPDRTIRKWDSDTGHPVGEPWQGHTGWIFSLALSPDGTHIASTSGDETVRFWDMDSGDLVGEPLEHNDVPWAVAFSPSGEFVATGGRDGTVSIWRVPWWDETQKQPKTSFLDLPAVTGSSPLDDDARRQQPITGFDCDQTFFDFPPGSQSRARNPNPNPHPSRTRGPAFSWKALPRLLFRRQHDSHRRLEVTTIHPGYAPQRTYVAPAGDETSTETPLEPIPTTPGDYGRYSVILISGSDSDSPEGDQASREIPVEQRSQFCCGLFSRRTARAQTAPPQPPPIELTQRTTPSSGASAPPAVTATQTTVQDMLDLPAVAGPSSDTA